MQPGQPENKTTVQIGGLGKCWPSADSPLASILADMVRSALAWEKTNGKPNHPAGASFQDGLTSADVGHTLDSYENVSGGEPNDCGN